MQPNPKNTEIMADHDISKMKVATFLNKNLFLKKNFWVPIVYSFQVADLKRELKVRGLNVTGNKNDLVERLQSALIGRF